MKVRNESLRGCLLLPVVPHLGAVPLIALCHLLESGESVGEGQQPALEAGNHHLDMKAWTTTVAGRRAA